MHPCTHVCVCVSVDVLRIHIIAEWSLTQKREIWRKNRRPCVVPHMSVSVSERQRPFEWRWEKRAARDWTVRRRHRRSVVRSKRDFYGIISYGLKWFMIRVKLVVAAVTTHSTEHFKTSFSTATFHHRGACYSSAIQNISIHNNYTCRHCAIPCPHCNADDEVRSFVRSLIVPAHNVRRETSRSRITMQFTIIKNNTTIFSLSTRFADAADTCDYCTQ